MLSCDGSPAYVQFAAGGVVSDPGKADLSLAFDGEFVKLRAIGGGIWVGNNDFLYAPDADYIRGADCKLWDRGGRNEYAYWTHVMLFYAKTGSTLKYCHGKLTMKNAGGTGVSVEVVADVNPSGSRDLRGGRKFEDPDPRGGHSTRVDVGKRPWWEQNVSVRQTPSGRRACACEMMGGWTKTLRSSGRPMEAIN
jgi:hypothetical protein